MAAEQVSPGQTHQEMTAALMDECLPDVLGTDAYPRLVMLAHKWFQCELEELLPHEREMLVRAAPASVPCISMTLPAAKPAIVAQAGRALWSCATTAL